jgi:hypothetical protein
MYASAPFLDLLGQNPSDRRMKFIEPQYQDDENGNPVYWIRYTYSKATPVGATMFQTYVVTRNGSNWTYSYNGTTKTVSTEVVDGETLYYITEGANISGKTYVKLERRMETRNGYPSFL